MIFAFLSLALSASKNERCMICASTLQAVQLEALKGKMTSEELQGFHAKICASFGTHASLCADLKSKFDSYLPQLTQQSAGKVCAKIGVCHRKRTTAAVVRKSVLPSSTVTEANGGQFCTACHAIVPVMQLVTTGATFACPLLTGPAAAICATIPWSLIKSLLSAIKAGCSIANCCKRAGLCDN